MVLHLGGPIILTKQVMQLPAYNPFDPDANVKWMDVAFEEFVAYTMREGADKLKYGEMLKNLQHDYCLKHNRYPKTL